VVTNRIRESPFKTTIWEALCTVSLSIIQSVPCIVSLVALSLRREVCGLVGMGMNPMGMGPMGMGPMGMGPPMHMGMMGPPMHERPPMYGAMADNSEDYQVPVQSGEPESERDRDRDR